MPAKKPKVFISYCHEDEKWLNQFKKYIKPYQEKLQIELWDDLCISPSSPWFDEINRHIQSADAAILLVTHNFLASKFITEIELPKIIEQENNGDLKIFWIACSFCAYELSGFAKLQALNDPQRPLESLSRAKLNKELTQICRKIFQNFSQIIKAPEKTTNIEAIPKDLTPAESVWQQACALLQSQLREFVYKTWIEPIKPLGIRDDLFFIEIENEIMKNIFESKYKTHIIQALKSVTSKQYEIKYKLVFENSLHQRSVKSSPQLNLNPIYTFDMFILGESNELAYNLATAVADAPAKTCNLFYVYAGVGLGKTHILHAIGHQAAKKNPNLKIQYLPMEQFVYKYIQSITANAKKQFIDEYKSLDIILFDDIHFLGSQETSQDVFYELINWAAEENKQIVMACDRSIYEMVSLQQRIRFLLDTGKSVSIMPPDLETRIAIINKNLMRDNINAPSEVPLYIAENFSSSIRELMGAVRRSMAYAALTNQPLTLDITKKALEDMIDSKIKKEISRELIIKEVARYFNIDQNDLMSGDQLFEYPKSIAANLYKELFGLSDTEARQFFGDVSVSDKTYERIKCKITGNPKSYQNVFWKKSRML